LSIYYYIYYYYIYYYIYYYYIYYYYIYYYSLCPNTKGLPTTNKSIKCHDWGWSGPSFKRLKDQNARLLNCSAVDMA